jgi:predicted kinase
LRTSPLVFDAIEFNPDLRFIDVVNEIAFLTMDLRHRGRGDLAWRCLNRYLEHTGDYPGLAALPYYQVYRAMVRAKVAAILAAQHGGDLSVCREYLDLADRLAHDRRPALILMHGVSGSGKTWHSQKLLEGLGAVRLRSDVERKRLFGLAPHESSAAVPGGIYTREAGERTLARLLELARGLLAAGFPVIVDATFLKRDWRDPFAALADELRVPWHIAAAEADPAVLRERVARRQREGRDASEAGLDVLEAQLASLEPFADHERPHVLRLNEDTELASHLQKTAQP